MEEANHQCLIRLQHSTDPKQNSYASELGVNIDSMRVERSGLSIRDVTV